MITCQRYLVNCETAQGGARLSGYNLAPTTARLAALQKVMTDCDDDDDDSFVIGGSRRRCTLRVNDGGSVIEKAVDRHWSPLHMWHNMPHKDKPV